jgi:hypothetical protein
MLKSKAEFYDGNADYDNAAPDVDHFLNFCDEFNTDEALYTWAGILTGAENENKETKLKPYKVFDKNDNWGMLSAYNYTIYAPTYEAMKDAQQNRGLCNWKTINAIYNDWENATDMNGNPFASEDDAKTYVKEQLQKMAKFVRYHTQNSSLFADKYFKNYDPETGLTEPATQYATFCSNNLGIAQLLTVTGGGDKLTVKDATGNAVVINASSPLANLLARDITVGEKTMTQGTFKTLESSSFVTIHGINKPLCYNSNGLY